MPIKKKNGKSQNGNGSRLGIENELFEAADKLRGHLDAAEYKSVVLGLIFLKYVSDIFEQVYARVAQEGLDDPEDRDVYLAERTFWVPKEARWKVLQDSAKQESIGNLIDQAMEAIERDNPSLKGMLPGNYGRATLDKRRLGDLVDLVSNKINFADEESRIFPLTVRQPGGAQGRRVLHPLLGGARSGGDARSLQRAGLRSLLRVGWHVRAEREIRRGAWRADWRYFDLWAGIKSEHLQVGQDESCHPGHRRRFG
jgi:hypothetical protein